MDNDNNKTDDSSVNDPQQQQPQENVQEQAPEGMDAKFTVQNLNQDIWKKKYDKIYFLTDQNEEETLPCMREALQLITYLNDCQDWKQVLPVENNIRKFFTGEFLFYTCKYLILNKCFRLPEALAVSNAILEQTILFCIKTLDEDNPNLIETLSVIFDLKKQYFKLNDQAEFGSNLIYPIQQPTEEYKQWFDSLKVGDIVDAIKQDQKYRRLCWSQAVVNQIISQRVHVKYLYEVDQDRWILMSSLEVQPLNTKCKDMEWRLNIQKGDIIDCYDTSNIWYNCTVLSRKEQEIQGQKYIEISIGYRVYSENGEKIDSDNRRFSGWSSKYDENFSVTSPRVARKNQFAKKLYMLGCNINDEIVDDSNDYILQVDGQKLYAVIRPICYRSVFIMKNLNKFGQMGGFTKILERIKNTQRWCPIELLCQYMDFLGQVNPMLFREFIQDYIPQLWQAVWNNLVSSPDWNVRNFTKERLDKVITNLSELLKRIFSIGEKCEMIDQLNLEIAKICFNSNFLDRRLQGLKTIMETLQSAKMAQQGSQLSIQRMKTWIEEVKLFEKLYDSDQYQLISRSGDFLKFLLGEDLLTVENLQKIWTRIKKGDQEAKQAVYKALSDASVMLKQQHLEFLVLKIHETEPEQVTTDDMELLHELTRFNSQKFKQLGLTNTIFYWNIICKQGAVTPEIVDAAVSKFSDFMRGWDMHEHRQKTLSDCTDNIVKNISVLPAIKIIRKIVDSLPNQPSSFDQLTKHLAMEDLFQEKKIVEQIINNIKIFKVGLRQQLQQNKQPTEEQLNVMMLDKTPYDQQIQQRIEMINFVYSNLDSNFQLTYETIAALWDELIINALHSKERDLLYKWFDNIASQSSSSSITIKNEDLKTFFIQKMCNQNDLQYMTEQGFNCFKNIFTIINEKGEGLQKIVDNDQQYPQQGGQGLRLHNNIQYPPTRTIYFPNSYISSYSAGDTGMSGIKKKKNDQSQGLEFKVVKDPSTLEGITQIWQLIFENNDTTVIENALEFLNKLYTNLGQDMLEKKDQIMQQYLLTSCNYLNQAIQKKEDDYKIIRCITILNSVIDESEKKGNGGLQSLTSLVRGELITLHFVNEHISGPGIPQKFNLKVPYTITVIELLYLVGLQVKTTYEEVKLFQYVKNGSINSCVQSQGIVGGVNSGNGVNSNSQGGGNGDGLGIGTVSSNIGLGSTVSGSMETVQQELKEKVNGKTLLELRIKNGETFVVGKREGPPVEDAELITKDNKMNPKAKKIFKSWFKRFQVDNKMTPEQTANFISSCTNDICKADDQRIKEVFQKYDTDKDGFLMEENFLEFYSSACRERKQVVWSNLQSQFYRRDLKRYDEVRLPEVDTHTLPRYLLAQDPDFFKMMFGLLELKKEEKEGQKQASALAQHSWQLLSRLPVAPLIYDQILQLQNVREKGDWEGILSASSQYQLIYALHVIEFLIQDKHSEENDLSAGGIKGLIYGTNKKDDLEEEDVEDPEEPPNESKNGKAEDHQNKGQGQGQGQGQNQNQKPAGKQQKKMSLANTVVNTEQEKRKKEDEEKKQQEMEEQSRVKRLWRSEFVKLGGFDHLAKIYQNLIVMQCDLAKVDRFWKIIVSFILRIFRHYMLASFSTEHKNIFRNVQVMQLLHIPLSVLVMSLNQQHQDKEDEAKSGELPDLDNVKRFESFELAIEKEKSHYQECKREVQSIEQNKEFWSLVETMQEGGLGQLVQEKLSKVATIKDDAKDQLFFQAFFLQQISLANSLLLREQEMESEDRMLVQESLLTAASLMLQNILLVKCFFEQVQFSRKLFLQGLFCRGSSNVRKLFSHVFFMLCHHFSQRKTGFQPISEVMTLLVSNMPSGENSQTSSSCAQYFDLLCGIIDCYQNSQDSTVDLEGLMRSAVSALHAHKSQETRTYTKNDKVLIGLLNLCDRIFSLRSDIKEKMTQPQSNDNTNKTNNLVMDIFSKCLFDILPPEDLEKVDVKEYDQQIVKCKGEASRAAAFKLLYTLCRNSPRNLQLLIEQGLVPLINKMPQQSTWRFFHGSEARSSYGYCGIRNLGCICYMNAMIQQFFTIPTFRYAILMADDEKQPKMVKKDYRELDDNVLHQFQRMFGFLDLTDRQDYNPQDFCYSFKDSAGQPVNVSVQQDAQEFLNMIFDKLEGALKGTPYHHILDGIFGGKTCTQLICRNCGKVRSREEQFYNISVEVKNLKHLNESFEKYIAGETISDYLCDNCNKKVDTTKRSCLSFLPNVLIIHLQRIVFDLDALQNLKVNTRLEFPVDLNLEPFTIEGLEYRESQAKTKQQSQQQTASISSEKSEESNSADKKQQPAKQNPYDIHPKEYYEYRLAGVVVHIGAAEYGHYYSYIDTQKEYQWRQDLQQQQQQQNGSNNQGSFLKPNQQQSGQAERWLEFNDSRIKDFSTKQIEAECFGGTTESSDDTWSWFKNRENSKNAYILVYERKVKDPIKLVFKNKEEMDRTVARTHLECFVKQPQPSTITDPNQQSVEKQEKVDISSSTTTSSSTVAQVENEAELKMAKKVSLKEQMADVQTESATGNKKPAVVLEQEPLPLIEAYVDYYKFKPYVADDIYKQVWKDNNKFMVEKHMFSDEFFKFIREITGAVELPSVTQQNLELGFYKDYENLPMEVRTIFKILIDVQHKIVFDLLSKSFDYKIMEELIRRLNTLMMVCPDYCYEFFDKQVLQRLPTIFEYLLQYNDKQIRQFVCQQMTITTNIIINFYQFKLDRKQFAGVQTQEQIAQLPDIQQKEYNILYFLQFMLNQLHTEVAKNWFKFTQYFEFWQCFSKCGPSQEAFCFQMELIAVFLDFFLEKKSPLTNFSPEKKYCFSKHSMQPNFDPLLDIVANLVKKTQQQNIPNDSGTLRQQRTLSLNDRKCLWSIEFWNKYMQETQFSTGPMIELIQHLAPGNQYLSEVISIVIMKGLHRVTSEYVKPYLEAMQALLVIQDQFTQQRIEWLLGMPHYMYKKINTTHHFGLYQISTLDDIHLQFISPLINDNSSTVLECINDNRRRSENLAVSCLRHLLASAIQNPQVAYYLLRQPSCNYLYANFLDFVRPYLEQYLQDSMKYNYWGFPREEVGNHTLSLFTQFEEKYKSIIPKPILVHQQQAQQQNKDEMNQLQPQQQQQQMEQVDSVFQLYGDAKAYIIGQTLEERLVQQCFFLEEQNSKNEEEQQQSKKGSSKMGVVLDGTKVFLNEYEITSFYIESQPTGITNNALPRQFTRDNVIFSNSIDQESPWTGMVYCRSILDQQKQSILLWTKTGREEMSLINYMQSQQQFYQQQGYNYQGMNMGMQMINTVQQMQQMLSQQPTPQAMSGVSDLQFPSSKLGQKQQGKQAVSGVGGEGVITINLDVENLAGGLPNLDSPEDNSNNNEQNQQNQQEDEEEKSQEEEEKPKDSEPPFKFSNCLRYIQITNESNMIIQVKISFVPKCNDNQQQQTTTKFKNMHQLTSPLQHLLKPQSKQIICTYTKIKPELDWDEYDIKVDSKIFTKFDKYSNWPTYFVSNLSKADLEVVPPNYN